MRKIITIILNMSLINHIKYMVVQKMKKEPNIVYLVGKIVQTDIGVVSAFRLTYSPA